MMTPRELELFCETLATSINDTLPTFAGQALRADAGEPGLLYVALRGAKKKPDLGHKLADRIAEITGDAIATGDHPIDFAISQGRGNKDLLLQIECRPIPR